MRRSFQKAASVVIMAVLAGNAPCPAAEGFGTQTKGGAGGRVIWVTNLNSDGPGSLREALDTKGPRVIKFKVAGTIELKRNAILLGRPFAEEWRAKTKAGEKPGPNPCSNVTVDGRSAPGAGIIIRGNMRIAYGASDVILRHLRIHENGYVARSGGDCITVTDGCRNILYDHCSFRWGRDETVNYWGTCSDATMQWCIVDTYGPHGYGYLNGAGTDRLTLHHNLLAHCKDRAPRIGGNVGRHDRVFPNPHPIIDIRNNVIYNWYGGGATALDWAANVNLVRNNYIPGPSTKPGAPCITLARGAVAYLEGNVSPNRPDNTVDEWADTRCYDLKPKHEGFAPPKRNPKAAKPFPAPPITEQSPDVVRDLVLAQAGAWPRDAYDAGVVRDVLDGTGWAGVMNHVPEDFTNARPKVSAAASGDSREVSFRGEASDPDGKILSYTWDFGDDHFAVGQSATHTYAKPGKYLATLVAMDNRGMTNTGEVRLTLQDGKPVVAECTPSRPVPALTRPVPTGDKPPTEIKIPRVAEEIAEGHFPSDAAWQAATRVPRFIMQHNWKPATEAEIDVRLLHDGKRLFLRCLGDCPAFGPVRKVRTSDDERWLHGCMEIYLSPQWGREPWFHFVVNLNGITYDAKGFDRHWDPAVAWTARSEARDKKWLLEVAIPLKAFGLTGRAFGLKLCHYRAKDEILLWPRLQSEDGRNYVVYSPDPTGYARAILE